MSWPKDRARLLEPHGGTAHSTLKEAPNMESDDEDESCRDERGLCQDTRHNRQGE